MLRLLSDWAGIILDMRGEPLQRIAPEGVDVAAQLSEGFGLKPIDTARADAFFRHETDAF
jgi:hypothetical protein